MPTCPNCGNIVMNGDPYCSNCETILRWTNKEDDTLTENTEKYQINWENVDIYKEVCKRLYPDGFHKTLNHGLWKLKDKPSSEEWDEVKEYFTYYTSEDENINGGKYFGWATVHPVDVMKILYALHLKK